MLAKEQLQVHRRFLHVFTDASSGQTAAAYCITELNIPVVYPVMSLYSLTALKLSLLYVKQNCKSYGYNQNIAILVTLFAVSNKVRKSACRPRMLDEIHRRLKCILWTLSHLSIKGDERAD